MHQGSVLPPFLLQLWNMLSLNWQPHSSHSHSVTAVLSELLHVDDLVLMSETIHGFRNKFIKWEALESQGLKVNLGKAKVIVSGGFTNVDLCN